MWFQLVEYITQYFKEPPGRQSFVSPFPPSRFQRQVLCQEGKPTPARTHSHQLERNVSTPLPGASPSHRDVQSLTHSLAEPRGVGTGCGHAPLECVGLTIWSGCPRAPLPGSSQSEVPTPQAWVPPLCCCQGPTGAAPTGPSPATMAATCAEGRRWSGLTQRGCVCGHRWNLPGRTHGGCISPCSVEEPRVPGPDRLTRLLRVACMWRSAQGPTPARKEGRSQRGTRHSFPRQGWSRPQCGVRAPDHTVPQEGRCW